MKRSARAGRSCFCTAGPAIDRGGPSRGTSTNSGAITASSTSTFAARMRRARSRRLHLESRDRRVFAVAERRFDPRRAVLRRMDRVITAADRPSVAAIVYIAAFAPDEADGDHAHGRSAARRTRAADPAAAGRFLFLDRAKFHASFAADVSAEQAASWPTRRSRGASTPWAPHQRAGVADKPDVPRRDKTG